MLITLLGNPLRAKRDNQEGRKGKAASLFKASAGHVPLGRERYAGV